MDDNNNQGQQNPPAADPNMPAEPATPVEPAMPTGGDAGIPAPTTDAPAEGGDTTGGNDAGTGGAV